MSSIILIASVWYIVGLIYIGVTIYKDSTKPIREQRAYLDKLLWRSLSLSHKLMVLFFVPAIPLLWPIAIEEARKPTYPSMSADLFVTLMEKDTTYEPNDHIFKL